MVVVGCCELKCRICEEEGEGVKVVLDHLRGVHVDVCGGQFAVRV